MTLTSSSASSLTHIPPLDRTDPRQAIGPRSPPLGRKSAGDPAAGKAPRRAGSSLADGMSEPSQARIPVLTAPGTQVPGAGRFYGLDDGARFRQHPAPGRSTACGTASLQTRRLHGQSWPDGTQGAPAMHQSASTLCACAVPKSARGADPGLCARRSCSSALPACSSSGSSAGWRCLARSDAASNRTTSPIPHPSAGASVVRRRDRHGRGLDAAARRLARRQ